jgi:hypothetical protein
MCRSPTGQRRSFWPPPVRLGSAPTVPIRSGHRNASGTADPMPVSLMASRWCPCSSTDHDGWIRHAHGLGDPGRAARVMAGPTAI